MTFNRIVKTVVPVAALLCALACVFAFGRVELKSSLYDLVGSAADSVPEAVRNGSDDVVPVLVSSKSRKDALDAAAYLADNLPTNECKSVRFRIGGGEIAEITDLCGAKRSGLVSPDDAVLLASPEGRFKVAGRAVKNMYSSFLHPTLFSVDIDPFALTDGFVKAFANSDSPFKHDLSTGFLTAEKDGEHHVLLVMELGEPLVGDMEALIAFRDRLENVLQNVRSESVSASACGIPMHSAYSAAKCRFETNILGLVSLLFVLLLSLLLFRSLKSIFLLAYLLLFSALSGSLALVSVFSEIHVVTVLFATTLLGLVIDYGYHWLLRRSGDVSATARSLVVSFATTELTLLPLLFSSIPVLRQSAVFIGVGLAAALVCAVFLFPSDGYGDLSSVKRITPPVKILRFFGVVAFAASLAGFYSLGFKTTVVSLYAPPEELADAERTLAEINGSADEKRGFLVTNGSGDLEILLEREESLDLPSDVPCLSRFMPSLKKRLARHEDITLLYREQGEYVKTRLGLEELTLPPEPQAWSWSDIPESLKSLFVRNGALIVSSVLQPDALTSKGAVEGVVFCRPRKTLEGILEKWTGEIGMWLSLSFLAMAIVLVALFRGKAFAVAFPSLASVVSVLGFLSLAGVSVNLFHLLALFLLAGMGVDYAVFARSGEENSVRSVTFAFLTSFVGFGSLAFVSFPVVRAFGLSLAIGLPVAYMTSLLFVPRKDTSEYASTPFGLALIWTIYRIFGLRFFHFAASATGFFMWICSPGVRRASPNLGKVVNFTRSLADKMVVMADGRSKPVVELDGSRDAEDFIADVSSRKGVFVLSSHVGTIEVLAALGECEVAFHAWMEFERTGVFNAFYLKHQRRNKVVIHPISEFNPGTVFFAGERLDEGDAILMAGDRSFGRKRTEEVDGRKVELAEGVFRFAAALEHPVYFVSCISTGGLRYRVFVKRMPSGAGQMSKAYAIELLKLRDAWPLQDFTWNA